VSEVKEFYEANAAAFDRDRGRQLMERGYLDDVLARLDPHNRHILDLGCGAGEPIARYLIDAGCRVTGVDASSAMIELSAARFPDMAWMVTDMRALSLGERFGAIVAWDSFFHLRAEDQRAMFPIFRDHVAPRGLLLFTSGPSHGEAIGDLYGQPLYHASLDAEEYRSLLAENGFEVLRHTVEDPECGRHTVWLAQAA
jgi:predicted TPR repeat methyltransferase